MFLSDLADFTKLVSVQVILEGEALAEDVQLEAVAASAEGYSGSDLRQLCVAAAMRPVRELLAASGKSAKAAATAKAAAAKGSAAGKGGASGIKRTAAGGEPDAPDAKRAAAAGAAGEAASRMAHDDSAAQPAPAAAVMAVADAAPPADSSANVPASPAADSDSALVAVAEAIGTASGDAADASDALLGRLLAECDALASEASAAAPAALRPVTAADFAAAQKVHRADSSAGLF